MLEDPLLRERCQKYLEGTRQLAERECERTKKTPDLHFLAQMYRRLYTEALSVFVDRCGTRLLDAFREYEQAGLVELITCAGTHGFLPVLSSEPTAVRAQVVTAVNEHERIFGQKPKGMWIPECAFYPGLDQVLADAGIRYFLVDSHAIEHATPRPLFGVSAPLYCPSGVAAFGRHPATSKLVWSSRIGYPADYNYRDYYRDIGFDLPQEYMEPFQYAKGIRTQTGIKYHRVTGPTVDKQLYNPDWASESAQKHAHDFVIRCTDQAVNSGSRMPFPPVLVSPYDAELFGHWWFEGPQWIYYVLKELSYQNDLIASTPCDFLKAHPIQQKAMPGPSSWGRNGYAEHWINPKTDWMYRPLHEAAVRMTQLAQRHRDRQLGTFNDRVLTQAARELMLAQSSDWPFIITNGTTEEYATRRFNEHIHRFHYLLNGLEWGGLEPEKLAALEQIDAIFPEMDYRLYI